MVQPWMFMMMMMKYSMRNILYPRFMYMNMTFRIGIVCELPTIYVLCIDLSQGL